MLLWIMDSYFSLKQRFEVKNKLLDLRKDLFLTSTHLLSSQDVNWWTGVVWIIVMFLSAVWALILTAPIHCTASIAETVMQCYISPNLMKKQTHLKQITNSLHDFLHQITWRLGTEILHHVPNSSPDDFNAFYEQLKNFGVRNYSKVSIEL